MSTFPGSVFVLALFVAGCLPENCAPPENDDGPPLVRPPERVPVRGSLTVANGLTPSDYAFWDGIADASTPVGTDGTFAGEASGRLAGVLFVTPVEGSATASKLAPGTGLYATPSPGAAHLTVDRSGATPKYTLGETGDVAIDATTTVLALLMQHPMLSNPWHAMAQEQVRWLVAEVNKGWPAVQQAATAWDTALAEGRDPAADEGFEASLATAVAEIADRMPEPAPLEAAFVEAAQGAAGDKLPFEVRSDGRVVSVLNEKENDGTKVKVEPYNERGTALDYYYEVWEMPGSDYRDGLESPRFQRPVRTDRSNGGSVVARGFVGARSYASYLDVVGNTLSYISRKVGEGTGISPEATVDMLTRRFYEVRFLSGGFQGSNPAEDYAHVQMWFTPESKAAFRHNMTTVVVEGLGTLPGGEKIFGEGVGGEVLQAVVTQVVNETEALISSKPASSITGEDLYGIVVNVVKAALDQLGTSLTTKPQENALKRVYEYFKWGAKTALKEVVGLPGKLAKGGSAANRAMRLARPDSLIELQVAAIGFEPKQTGILGIDEKIDGKCLGEHGNLVKVQVSGRVKAEGRAFTLTDTEHTYNDMGEFIQTVLTKHTNGGGLAETFDINFTEPSHFETTGELGPGRRYVWTWLGFQNISVGHQWADDTWFHTTLSGKRYTASGVSLFGAEFTASAKTRWRLYEVQDDGSEWMTEQIRFYNYKLVFQ